MMIISIIIAVICFFIVVHFRLHLLLNPKDRLIILMYHQISDQPDDLTVTPENLEKQFSYLTRKKYRSKFFNEIDDPCKKSIIITFDDGYLNNFEYLPGLLEKYNLKATLFIATKFIQEGYKEYRMMSFEDLRSLNANYFEIGLHSHNHQNFRTISNDTIQQDLRLNMDILEKEGISYSKVLAYPYGKYPKEKRRQRELFNKLKDMGILFAVRIGNSINSFHSDPPYTLCRVDIKGGDSMIKFKLKLIFGKLKLF
ncbi:MULTISPECIES: polysaccharide deacetylase family protein [Chryseobacterium]|uniref:Peptidoglycan/xylan/chitin deacetylase (PgdA/CDA1 family) n=1 Tax=Chryseobacterium camelliae TaxID=1265445 RepID=A0ABU0TM00_9FLAO|nr:MULTISPECIES: polysaccharide deacetylase family protein [Chryseobacterium]MDT3408328.1 peptidoglycan/xylan/chitin deacetylase (PgdA/CDA1 family) [Pseudacidovorax intermedius]MDQ1097816.1 peptidoglycan/xylan/chitin deacetylase (PgdA/CDA1 family) [Chryseobacterium camelliae]MDQ1101748.1 peptidoglycan/xylan/chitin deacetylase (PgdA/CDA1 family) [Chryseobacterium sp. SORGH_AS_1048]MDR6085188.1 peptidoglycan/xylan/chitin deacetylase (PgdA/CDA1 family) [Chryseobacterium sp. SORGH_AS_0909]MDR61295